MPIGDINMHDTTLAGMMTCGVCYHDEFRIKITPERVVFICASCGAKTKLNPEMLLQFSEETPTPELS